MIITIRGIGVVGAFGNGVTALKKSLVQRGIDLASINTVSHPDESFTPVYFAKTTELENYFSNRALRRVDHFSKLALLGACLALDDAGQLNAPKDRLGLIVATGYGPAKTTFSFLDSFINDGDQLASPTFFSNSVHNSATAYLSILLKISGPSLTFSQFELSFGSALLTARQWLQEKRVDAILLGAVDEYGPVLSYCWHRFFGQNPGEEIDPLNFSAQTAIPGEGAAFFYLTTDNDYQSPACYAHLGETSMGRIPDVGLALSTDAPLFLGADGHSQCGKGYEAILTRQHTVAAYSPLYGSLPTGQGFDMAIAALSLKTGIFYKQPGKNVKRVPLQTIARQTTYISNAVRCLKLGPNREFGIITLERHGMEA